MKKRRFIIGIMIIGVGLLTIIFLTDGISRSKRMGAVRAYNRVFYFVQDQTAQVSDALNKKNITQISIPFYPQEHALTCEVAALRMALGFHGVEVTEDELINKLKFSAKGPRNSENIWGDPELGFVGDIDGSIFNGTGYGVYNNPIYDVAIEYRPSYVLKYPDLSEVLEEVKSGNPVIVWGLLSKREPIVWQTENGKMVEGYPGEHALVVIGFYGTVANPTKIILMDPIYGKIRMSKEKFLSNWEIMKNRTVVVY